MPALNGPHADEHRRGTRGAGAIATFQTSGNGYFVEMATRPQTIGYALLDSPVALAAWMIDHDTDAYYKIASAFVDAQPSGNLTRDHILDNITTYWLTGTGASAARSYWEAYGPDAPAAGREPLPAPRIPFAFSAFPGEIWRTPRSWVEQAYPNVTYFGEAERAATSPPGRSRSSSRPSCERRSGRSAEVTSGGSVRFGPDGAAPESNRPSRGLHDRTGFEDPLGHRARPLRCERTELLVAVEVVRVPAGRRVRRAGRRCTDREDERAGRVRRRRPLRGSVASPRRTSRQARRPPRR